MTALSPMLILVHLIGLTLAVGCATAKLILLLRCRTDPAFIPAYNAVARPLTRLLILGLVLLTLSGLGWLIFRLYPWTPRLGVKLVLVAAVWILGPVIDNVAEPRFRQLAPAPGAAPSADFLRAERQYLLLEVLATGLFYAIMIVWVLL